MSFSKLTKFLGFFVSDNYYIVYDHNIVGHRAGSVMFRKQSMYELLSILFEFHMSSGAELFCYRAISLFV